MSTNSSSASSSNNNNNTNNAEEMAWDPTTVPRDATIISLILQSMGLDEDEFEPRVVNQLMEFMYRYLIHVALLILFSSFFSLCAHNLNSIIKYKHSHFLLFHIMFNFWLISIYILIHIILLFSSRKMVYCIFFHQTQVYIRSFARWTNVYGACR